MRFSSLFCFVSAEEKKKEQTKKKTNSRKTIDKKLVYAACDFLIVSGAVHSGKFNCNVIPLLASSCVFDNVERPTTQLKYFARNKNG